MSKIPSRVGIIVWQRHIASPCALFAHETSTNTSRWPVIAAIIIASLIVLSIVTCIARCCCCGYSCCCSCFSFLKCCDCCGDSCAGKKNKPMKHLDEPGSFGAPAYNQGYKAPEPMMGGALPAKSAAPTYAQFEVGKNGLYTDPVATPLSEDALPPMPSWDSAAKKHVLEEDEKNGVELGALDPKTGQHLPLMAGGVSPAESRGPSPFGARPAPSAIGTGYSRPSEDNYDQNQAAYNGNARGYGGSPLLGPGQGPRRIGTPQMRGSPAPGQGMRRPGFEPNQSYNSQARGYESNSPGGYGQNDGFDAAPVQGYGRAPPRRQFSNDQYQDDQYGNRPFQPSRQYSSDSQQPLASTRQYSDGHGYHQDNQPPRINRLASPPLQNNSGFDFGGQPEYQSRPSPPPQQYRSSPGPQQFRRPSPPQQRQYESSNLPQQDGYFSSNTPAPTYATRTPPPPEEPTYPGYKPYQPSSGGRRDREPQRWDPVQQ